MCLDEDVDPNGPCQQYTEANDVLRDLKSNLREDKQLLMQVLASVWRKVMPLPSILNSCLADFTHAFSGLCLAQGDASTFLLNSCHAACQHSNCCFAGSLSATGTSPITPSPLHALRSTF